MSPIAQLIADLLEGAREIEIDGTPSQVGPSADVIRRAAEALARQEELLAEAGVEWRPIATMPFGHLVMLFFEGGEKGNGEIDTNWVYPSDGEWDLDGSADETARASTWSYWTWGGPNSGSDFERYEKPTMWADPEPLVRAAARLSHKLKEQ